MWDRRESPCAEAWEPRQGASPASWASQIHLLFRASLDIEWGSAMLRACTRDVSSNGMFIESVDPLWIGAGFTANLMLDHPVKVVCSVKRVEPGRGMGVSVSFPEQQQETYLQLITRLSRTQP